MRLFIFCLILVCTTISPAYGQLYPDKVVGFLTHDEIIIPVAVIEEDGQWVSVPDNMHDLNQMLSSIRKKQFSYHAYSENGGSTLLYAGRTVLFYGESFLASGGFLAKCPRESSPSECKEGASKGGYVLTWEASPLFFGKKMSGDVDVFKDKELILETLKREEENLIGESTHIERGGLVYTRKGGVPVEVGERENASIKITYWQASGEDNEIHLSFVEVVKSYEAICTQAIITGIVSHADTTMSYLPPYYSHGCDRQWSGGETIPQMAFELEDRSYLMTKSFGNEATTTNVFEVSGGNVVRIQ